MKHFFKKLLFETNLGLNLNASFFLLLVIITLFSCSKTDFLEDKDATVKDIEQEFFKHDNPLSPSVDLVLKSMKVKMNDKQIAQFVGKAGLIIWEKAKVYTSPGLKNVALRQNGIDSIVILPVALPKAHIINAALVARIYNNGDSIVYSTHFKNHFSSIKSTPLPDYKITAKELYILGMAQLDAEVFGHKKFIVSDKSLKFGKHVNSIDSNSAVASIAVAVPMCWNNFTYSSSVVFPPVVLWSYYGQCGSPKLSPPAFFLQDLDETYGLVSYSAIPVGEGNGGTTSPYSLQFSTFYQSLTSNQQAFLDNQQNHEYYFGFIDYLILHQFSQQSHDHIVWCINYLLSPTTLITSFSEFASSYLNDFPSLSFLQQDDINWLNSNPYLKSRVYYFLQNPYNLNAQQKVQFHITKMRTESSYFTFNFAYSTYPEHKDLWFNDYVYLYPFGGNVFGEWAINHLMQNPTIPFETFHDQYLFTPYECNYQLSQRDQQVFDQLDAEDNLSDLNHQNLDCQGTKRTGNVFFQGTKEHWMIELDYVSRNPVYGDIEFAIPNSSATNPNNRGYADIVNLQNKKIFEIKPDNRDGRTSGAAEVANYVQKANDYCSTTFPFGVPWSTGTNYPTTLIPTSTPNKYLQSSLYAPGVIVYSTVVTSNPVPAPVVVPVDAIVKLRHLIDRLKRNFTQAANIIAEFLSANSELVTYIKSAAVGVGIAILVGTILEDIITVGAGLVDDWPCFVLAYRIIRFAMV